jgi:hypothetical protein
LSHRQQLCVDNHSDRLWELWLPLNNLEADE